MCIGVNKKDVLKKHLILKNLHYGKPNKKTILNEGADPLIFQNARNLSENMTEAEELLWEELRLKKLDGFKFRRQHPIGIHILDFYCFKKRLGIELDGGYHNVRTQQQADECRTNILAKQYIKRYLKK